MALFENRLTKALCVYVGFQRHPIPALHADEVKQSFGQERAMELLPKLDEIVSFAVNLTVGGEIDLGALGKNAMAAVRRKYPAVGKRGRMAVAWYVGHHWQ